METSTVIQANSEEGQPNITVTESQEVRENQVCIKSNIEQNFNHSVVRSN